MSKKLKAAMLAGKVTILSKQSGQVSVWYRDREGERQTVTVTGFTKVEMAPKLTDAQRLQWSNLEELVKARAIKIL